MTASQDSVERRSASALDLARSGGRDARIEIAEYDSSWPERFEAEATRLSEIVADVAVHHIGSTAVPGLPAKPIIDMMAVVEDLDFVVSALTDQAGYQYPTDYNATLQGRKWPSATSPRAWATTARATRPPRRRSSNVLKPASEAGSQDDRR